jgi:hypothetical protein
MATMVIKFGKVGEGTKVPTDTFVTMITKVSSAYLLMCVRVRTRPKFLPLRTFPVFFSGLP